MAGKHTGAFSPEPVGSAGVPGFAWHPRVTRAYAEGRSGAATSNHLPGSEAALAHNAGFLNRDVGTAQFETAITGSFARAQMGLSINMWRNDGPRLPDGREIIEDNGFGGLRMPGGTIENYYQASVGNGFWGYNPINDVDASHQSRIDDHNDTIIIDGLTFTPENMQDFMRTGDTVSWMLNIIDDQQGQADVAARWLRPIGMVELGNELFFSVYGNLVADFAAYKVTALSAMARWNSVLPDTAFGAVISSDEYDKGGGGLPTAWDLAVEADDRDWFDKYVIHIYTMAPIATYPTPLLQYEFAIDFFDTNWPDVVARWNDKPLWLTEWGMLIDDAGSNVGLDAFYQSEYAEYWAANVLMTFLAEPLVEFAAVHSWQVFVRSPNTPLFTAYQKLANIPGKVTTITNDAFEHTITIGAMTATLMKQSPYSFTVTKT